MLHPDNVGAGSKGGASCRQPVDVLRSHVAEAQARANHIVDEFESMLLVTGGHSMKEVMRIQSQAGLASRSPPAVRDRHQVSCRVLCFCSMLLLYLCKPCRS